MASFNKNKVFSKRKAEEYADDFENYSSATSSEGSSSKDSLSSSEGSSTKNSKNPSKKTPQRTRLFAKHPYFEKGYPERSSFRYDSSYRSSFDT